MGLPPVPLQEEDPLLSLHGEVQDPKAPAGGSQGQGELRWLYRETPLPEEVELGGLPLFQGEGDPVALVVEAGGLGVVFHHQVPLHPNVPGSQGNGLNEGEFHRRAREGEGHSCDGFFPDLDQRDAALPHLQLFHSQKGPGGRGLGGQRRPPLRGIGVPSQESSGQGGHQHGGSEELVGDGGVHGLVVGPGQVLRVPPQGEVEGQALECTEKGEPGPRPPIPVLGPAHETGHEGPDRPVVVVEGIEKLALCGEEPGTPTGGDDVGGQLPKGPLSLLRVHQSEGKRRSGPGCEIVVGASRPKDPEGQVALLGSPVPGVQRL